MIFLMMWYLSFAFITPLRRLMMQCPPQRGYKFRWPVISLSGQRSVSLWSCFKMCLVWISEGPNNREKRSYNSIYFDCFSPCQEYQNFNKNLALFQKYSILFIKHYSHNSKRSPTLLRGSSLCFYIYCFVSFQLYDSLDKIYLVTELEHKSIHVKLWNSKRLFSVHWFDFSICVSKNPPVDVNFACHPFFQQIPNCNNQLDLLKRDLYVSEYVDKALVRLISRPVVISEGSNLRIF